MEQPAGAPEPPSLPVRILVTGFFSGYSPVASGTAGSLVALLFFLIPGFEAPGILFGAVIAALFTGLLYAERFCSEGNNDPSVVVIDEMAGMWVSMFFLPVTLPVVAAAFVLFRGFDIVKPFPVRNMERLPGGWGIMLDDIAAGVYTNILIHAYLYLVR